MSDPAALAAEHDAILAELLQLGLVAARKVTARLEAAEDDETIARLGHTFSRVTRAMRQTVALREKLVRDAQRAARDEVAAQTQARRTHRRDQVKASVERLIWSEHENDDDLLEALDLALDEDFLTDGFGEDSLDAHIARICEEIGVDPPPQGEVAQRAGGGCNPPTSDTAPSNPLTGFAGAPPEGEHLGFDASG